MIITITGLVFATFNPIQVTLKADLTKDNFKIKHEEFLVLVTINEEITTLEKDSFKIS